MRKDGQSIKKNETPWRREIKIKKHSFKNTDEISKKIELDTGSKIKGSTTLKELLKRPNFHYSDLIKYNLTEKNLASSIQEGVK